MNLLASARQFARQSVLQVARRAAAAYVAGERLEDATRVAGQLFSRGLGVSLGYWDGPSDTPRGIAGEYHAAIDALENHDHAYVSVKGPAVDFSSELLSDVAAHAARARVRLHFDSHGPEAADQTKALLDALLDLGPEMSFTLPGRWRRSLSDAEWAIERGIIVRLVKGQWADPENPKRDLRAGFLEVVDALAGRARHVALASHDPPLVAEAVKRLRERGTSCQLELLYGLPMRKSLRQADALGLGVHVYIPYGQAYLPYALSRMRKNPKMAWWLLRDFVAAKCSRERGVSPSREFANQT